MITIDIGWKCKGMPKISINGGYISTVVGGKAIRDIRNKNWYDQKHKRVMEAVNELDSALIDMFKEWKESQIENNNSESVRQ